MDRLRFRKENVGLRMVIGEGRSSGGDEGGDESSDSSSSDAAKENSCFSLLAGLEGGVAEDAVLWLGPCTLS